jgi:hypothetical protein
MKPIKLLAAAALMLSAVIGVPSAMAEPTGLCSTDAGKENPCESVVTHVHETSVGKGVLLTNILNVECDVLFLGDVTGEGSPLKIKGNFAYSSCNGGECEVKEVSSSAVIAVLKEGHETATVTGGAEALVKCGFFLHCVYNGGSLKGTAKGPLLSTQKNGETSIQGQAPTKVSGFLCPSTASLDITTTPLSPTYIVGAMECVPDLNGAYAEPDPDNSHKCKNKVGRPNGTWELTS